MKLNITSRPINLHIYHTNLNLMDEGMRRMKSNRIIKPSRTRWLNQAIAEKLEKEGVLTREQIAEQPEEYEELADTKIWPYNVLVGIKTELVRPMEKAVGASGVSRTRWINQAIAAYLGMDLSEPISIKGEPKGMRVQLMLYVSNQGRLDIAAKRKGVTLTKWVNDAIKEKAERDKLDEPLPPAPPEAPRVPKMGPHWRPKEKPAEPEQVEPMEGVPVAKLAEDEELTEFDWG